MLQLVNVESYYGGIQALKGLDISVQKGEIVTLIGSNGAGKSTTLKSISGLVKVTTGSIVYNGVDISNKPAHETTLLGIAHVPEGRRIFPKLTVMENLRMGAFSVKDKHLIQERMERVFHYFPKLKRSYRAKGRHDEWWRTANACHWTSSNAATQFVDAR